MNSSIPQQPKHWAWTLSPGGVENFGQWDSRQRLPTWGLGVKACQSGFPNHTRLLPMTVPPKSTQKPLLLHRGPDWKSVVTDLEAAGKGTSHKQKGTIFGSYRSLSSLFWNDTKNWVFVPTLNWTLYLEITSGYNKTPFSIIEDWINYLLIFLLIEAICFLKAVTISFDSESFANRIISLPSWSRSSSMFSCKFRLRPCAMSFLIRPKSQRATFLHSNPSSLAIGSPTIAKNQKERRCHYLQYRQSARNEAPLQVGGNICRDQEWWFGVPWI